MNTNTTSSFCVRYYNRSPLDTGERWTIQRMNIDAANEVEARQIAGEMDIEIIDVDPHPQPIAGVDFDPAGAMSEDEYTYLTNTGQYGDGTGWKP